MTERDIMGIYVGLTGWGDHPYLYRDGTKTKDKLATYSAHFPIVEVDNAFYGIPAQQHFEKWCEATAANFKFVIKAHQSMTGHSREPLTNQQAKETFQHFKTSIEPVIHQNKLLYVLFQFPPWFDVRKAHINKLRKIKQLMPELPIAIEFRHHSWFEPNNTNHTLQLLAEMNWINTICDEPQAGSTSIPIVLEATHHTHAYIRMHGRNIHGWNRNGRGEEWRKVRFLYRYNQTELKEWQNYILTLQKKVKHISIVFNNNSGGDAAVNAKQFIDLMHLDYENLNPKQLDMFDF